MTAIDLTQYRMLTPAQSTLNVHKALTVYYRNGDIITYNNDTSTLIDLKEVLGCQNEDFNLVFINRDKKFISKCKKSEDWLQAIYNIFDFKQTDYDYVEVLQLGTLEFLDAIYNVDSLANDTNQP